MRHPTPDAELFAWHTNAMRGALGDEVALPQDPQAGWYKRKLVKGGPFVPARIFMLREIDEETGELLSDEILRCEVGGLMVDADEAWAWLARNPISKQEFDYMTALANHVAQHEADQPQANPRKPIDWLGVRPPEFK